MSEIVEALYDFQPQSDGDVELKAGQTLEVQEHLSADWLRGKNLDTGKEGVFPANYVKPGEKKRSFSRPAAPAPQGGHSDYPQAFSEKEQYQPPPPSWGQPQNQPPQYQQYAPPQQYQPPQPQYQPPEQIMMPPQQQQQQQQPQQQHHHHHFGNIARRFGDSMLFGAGATLGGDIINKIF